MRKVKCILYFIIVFSVGCKQPYTPAPITANNNYLVVEGLINISDSTFINLSRTVNVMAKTTTKAELKATITIESNTGGSYPLKEVSNGLYAAPNYNLSASGQYRLRIKTANNNTYTSDFTQAKVTPPIDSIIRDMRPDGIHFGVSAHDATSNTKYYRWDFAETWQFTSFFESHATAEGAATSPLTQWPGFVGSGIALLPRTNDIYHCWGNNVSHLITLNTTAGLSGDVINNQPITLVASSSEKLSIRYSIIVRQYALTRDGYDFFTLLKKNTEQLGSIFDSQPSASVGNIHNVNIPAEPVIGYISAGTISQQRIYINYTDLPKQYIADYLNNTPYNKNTCDVRTIYVHDPLTGGFDEYEYLIRTYPYSPFFPVDITSPFKPTFPFPMGSISASTAICVDCTLRGTNVKPGFWQ